VNVNAQRFTAPNLYSTCPITAAVSIGRCNTRSEPQVQEFQGLRIIRERKSKEKASCLGKSELQPEGSVRLKRIARSIDQRVLHRPSEPAALLRRYGAGTFCFCLFLAPVGLLNLPFLNRLV
jgi:hypothetical protein